MCNAAVQKELQGSRNNRLASRCQRDCIPELHVVRAKKKEFTASNYITSTHLFICSRCYYSYIPSTLNYPSRLTSSRILGKSIGAHPVKYLSHIGNVIQANSWLLAFGSANREIRH